MAAATSNTRSHSSAVVSSSKASEVTRFVPRKPISTDMLVHNDHRMGGNSDDSDSEGQSVARGGVVTPFPWKVHDMLEKAEIDGIEGIVCWVAHGRSFMVHRPQEFVDQIMPNWFSQTKFASFQRQLNLYGFRRLTTGRDKGAYFHPHFLRGERTRIQRMSRQKIKGTKVRRSIVPGMEPDFWGMSFMPTKANNNNNKSSCSSIHIKLPLPAPSHVMSDESDNSRITDSGPPTPTLSMEDLQEERAADVLLFFEGKPFHYLDRAILTESFPNQVVSSSEWLEAS